MHHISNKFKVAVREIPLIRGATKHLCLKLSLTRVEDLKVTLRGCKSWCVAGRLLQSLLKKV